MGDDPHCGGFRVVELRCGVTARRRLAGGGSVPQQMYRVPQLAAPQAAQCPGVGSLSGTDGNAYEKPGTFD